MSGQQQQPGRGVAPNEQPQFATYWPSYFTAVEGGSKDSLSSDGEGDGGKPNSRGQQHAADEERAREQRIQRRKQANRESAKRSKMKRQQQDRDLQQHARQVDDERDALLEQLTAAQQRYADTRAAHYELRRKIQHYSAGGNVLGEAGREGSCPSPAVGTAPGAGRVEAASNE